MFNAKDFYPTPGSLARKMLSGIKIDEISNILEPSAGKGDIVDAITEKIKVNDWAYRGSHTTEIDTIEIEPDLRHILKGKGYRVIHNDFLTLETHKQYDLIIMNPPFSEGDKHLLKALNMQTAGGQVICLLNAETLRNPFSVYRKDLIRKLEDYNADIEFIPNAFIDAERKTPVEVALIKVTIPEAAKISSIITGLKNEERHEIPVGHTSQLTQGEFYKNIVEQYNFEIKAGLKLINEYHAMKPLILKTFKDDKHNKNPIIKLYVEKERYKETPKSMANDYIQKVRYKYWQELFESEQFNSLFTSNLRTEYHNKIQELANYDFSLYNIEQIKQEILESMTKSIEQTILDLFDEFSHRHHYAEYSKNVHFYNGWKTNKAHLINKKVIIPMYNAFDSWSGRFNPDHYSVANKISDIQKVFDYLDDGTTETIHLESALKTAEHYGQTRKIETKYFYVTFYKKGTCHLEFKNLDLLKKFNIFGSQRKGWLPPTYGKKTYQAMTAEEQAIINEFEGGEKEYQKTIANKDYYICNTLNVLLLAS